jgi:hypothetical protein
LSSLTTFSRRSSQDCYGLTKEQAPVIQLEEAGKWTNGGALQYRIPKLQIIEVTLSHNVVKEIPKNDVALSHRCMRHNPGLYLNYDWICGILAVQPAAELEYKWT